MQRTRAIAAVSLFGFFTAVVHADESPPPPPPARAGSAVATGCRQDIQTFCSAVAPGGGRVIACLKTHRDQLSSDCRTAFKTARIQRQQAAGGQPPSYAPPGSQSPSSPPPSSPPSGSPPPSGAPSANPPPAAPPPKNPPPTQ